MAFVNPFAGVDKVQADGKGSWIPAGKHHFNLLQLSINESTNPQARPGTAVVIANLECIQSDSPTTCVAGRQYDRVWIFAPPLGAAKAELDQNERNLRETKQLFQALLGFEPHEGDRFDEAIRALGMTQEVFCLGACQPDNLLGGRQVYCEAVTAPNKRDPSKPPFVNSTWHPVK